MPKVVNIKNLLTIEDLLKFCEEQKFSKFSSVESGYKLAVHVPATFEEESNDENHRGMMKVKVKIFHTGLNRNGSFVSKEAAEKAMKTIPDKPILAAIHELDNGELDFAGHEMEEIELEDGTTKTVYIESQIGSFTASIPAFWETDENGKEFVCAYGYISEEYTEAANIIRRKEGTKNSCELFIDKLSYNAHEKYLELEDFYLSGSTFLGSRKDGTEIGEGMQGSRADIVDFSEKNNAIHFNVNKKLIEAIDKLNDTLSMFNDINSMKGGKDEVTKLEELLNKYNKAIEDITFEYEGLSDDELELAFAEAFDSAKKKVEDDDTPAVVDEPALASVTPAVDEKQEENEPALAEEKGDDVQEVDDEDPADDNDAENFSEEDSENVETEEVKVGEDAETEENSEEETDSVSEEPTTKMSIEINGIKKEFSVSMNQKLEAISNLVNDTYADDMTWYCCEVYDDEKKVVMIDCWNGRAYRQSYKCKNDVYSLTGDRVSVYSTWMSADEQKAFDKMKADFAEITNKYEEVSTKLSKYEAEPDKMAVLESEEYSSIADKAEFAELKEMKNHFDLSIDEIKAKADQIIVQYAKAGALTFASTENNNVGAKKLVALNAPKKRSRYGGLGKKED